MPAWRCPVCKLDLAPAVDERAWLCEQNHRFDIAREGYVNLLITHQRRQRDPGDSADMVRSRREFLDGGWYDPLRDALQEHAPGDGESACDAGCGEGFYTRGWSGLWAFDIAKPAVRAAAKRAAPGGHYAVASAYDIPLADAAVDVLVSVFAPLHSAEFERVVKPGGRVVTVTPGPEHLAGLAAELFDVVEPHPADGPFDRAAAAGETLLAPAAAHRISYEATIDRPGAVAALLGMTPYWWYVDQGTRERVGQLRALSTAIDFLVHIYRR